MKNKLFKNIAVIAVFVFLFSIITVTPGMTQGPDIGTGYAANTGLVTATETDPRQMAVDIVKYLMTFLGIIAVCVILYGGFIWMTASGNEDKVDKAKKIIIAGAIGLVVVLAAYAIVNFVIGITNDALSGDIV